jgi:hypothetical protein
MRLGPQQTWPVAIVILGLALGAGCGGSGGSHGSSTARDGGAKGGNHTDAGGSGKQRDASLGAGDASTGMDAGAAPSGSGDGGSVVGSATGGFGDFWKQASTELLSVDPTKPSQFNSQTIDIPALLPDPADGLDTDIYQQFVGDQLVTYAYRSGETVYYRLTQAASKVDDTTYILLTSDGTDSHLYTLEAGLLVDTGSYVFDQIPVTRTTRFRKLTSSFPPSNWPTTMVEGPP